MSFSVHDTKSAGSLCTPVQKVHVSMTDECTATRKRICFTQKSWLYPAFVAFLVSSCPAATVFPGAPVSLQSHRIYTARTMAAYPAYTFARVIVMLRHLFKQIFRIIISSEEENVEICYGKVRAMN